MKTADVNKAMTRLFSELVDGVTGRGGYVLNRGDIGLLKSLEKISAADASRSVNGGATIAAHAQHLRYGLSLMNQWASEGGDPFANAKWDEAWKMAAVDDAQWGEIRGGLHGEAERWQQILQTPREVNQVGAIRQINKDARGPKEGTFS